MLRFVVLICTLSICAERVVCWSPRGPTSLAVPTSLAASKPPVSREFLDPSRFSENELSVFSESTRLLTARRYAKNNAFKPRNLDQIPSIFDLSPPRELTSDDPERRWLSLGYRGAVIGASYLLFPVIINLLEPFVDVSSSQIDTLTSCWLPGISILFGTLCSLTANILYQRQARLQQTVSEEASLLAASTQNVLHLLRANQPDGGEFREARLMAGQAVADYVATLVGDSRGTEIMRVAIDDPITRMRKSVSLYEDVLFARGRDLGAMSSLVSELRYQLTEIGILRARRLSDEALALPPTHFLILAILSVLILAGFILVSLGSVVVDPVSGVKSPTPESTLLFSILCGVYTLFYNFSRDLNSPFEGVYQIRRSQTAALLIKTKRLMMEVGLGDEVNFGYDNEGERTT